jgi:conjugative relaxase-like TrwC/TraI family protein
VLSVAKLSPGQEVYYAASVADGLEDYYAGRGEAPGIWHGGGAATLGLSGVVSAEDLRAIVRGVDPVSGEQLRPIAKARMTKVERVDPVTGERYVAERSLRPVAGFDLVFAAPKSVSVLHALGSTEQRDVIRRAHESAWRAALAYLEAEACVTRRGRAGVIREVAGGFVASAFPHRTSRAQDPHLHTHVVVANVAQSPDERWRALDGVAILQTHRLAAGYLYQAHLRSELSHELGVEWTATQTGQAELACVPSEVVVAFSQRRAQLVAHLEETGRAGWHAAQAAAVITRARKESLDLARLTDEWRARAAELGFDLAAIDHAFQGEGAKIEVQLGRLAGELLGPEGLTARGTTFSRPDVIMAIAERLPAGAPAPYIGELADRLLATSAVERLDDATPGRPPAYTTTELLDREHELVAIARRLAEADMRGRSTAGVERVLERQIGTLGLTAEQAEAARVLATSTRNLEVLVGVAGSGKTSSIAAVAEALDYAGYTLVGAAPSAVAAQQLEHATGIPSTTLHRLVDPASRRSLTRRTCVIVDEAGMADTRTLLRLLQSAEKAAARVVLVGDPNQLSAVGPGGALSAIIGDHGATYLDETHRQRDPAEREALGQLRHGDARSYLVHAARTARLHLSDTREEAVARVVRSWWEHGRANPAENLMIALRRSEVDALNQAARARMQRAGRLGDEIETATGLPLAIGDRVVLRRNDHARGIANGTRGAIVLIEPDRGITVQSDHGAMITVPRDYLDAGHIQHGYAITGHQAQGTTVERAYVLAPEAGRMKEWAYVALSRARSETHISLSMDEVGTDEQTDPLAAFLSHIERAGAEEMATRRVGLEIAR